MGDAPRDVRYYSSSMQLQEEPQDTQRYWVRQQPSRRINRPHNRPRGTPTTAEISGENGLLTGHQLKTLHSDSPQLHMQLLHREDQLQLCQGRTALPLEARIRCLKETAPGDPQEEVTTQGGTCSPLWRCLLKDRNWGMPQGHQPIVYRTL